MITVILALVFAIPSQLLAPQLDFVLVPPPQVRKKDKGCDSYGWTVYVRTASGKEDGAGSQGIALNPLMCADDLAGSCGRRYWGYDRSEKERENLKVTLLDVNGDPIVSVRVESYIPFVDGTEEGGKAPAPPILVKWVPRAAPPVTTRVLTPYVHGGTPLARAASGTFAGIVSTVAAPQVDFDAIPKDAKWPRVYNLHVISTLATGERWVNHLDGYTNSKNEFTWENYRIQSDQLTRRIGVLSRTTVGEDGTTKTHRVVGMEVKSHGPAPGVRWTFRPEYRKKFLRE